MSKKNKNLKIVKVTSFLTMLRQIHLGGLLEECVLTIKEGVGHVEAVDITNSLIVICTKSLMSKNVSAQLGLGNLDILIKFLSTIDNDKLHLKYNESNETSGFELKKSNGRRKLNYLLTQPDLIATQLQSDEKKKKDPYKKMLAMMDYKIALTSSFIKDFLSYINLLKTKDVSLEFDGSELVTFICGGTNDHKFELVLSTKVESDEDESDEFNIKINGEFLAKILMAIDFDNDNPPTLSFAEDKLVMIEDGNAAWALVPLTDLDSE